jgi:flagellar motor switch protein FliG
MSPTADARMAALHMAPLSGAEKVAVLLLALGKGKAERLLRRFEPDELKLLTRSVTDLRPVAANDVETLVEEFAQKFANGVKFLGTSAEIKDLLSGVMTEEQYAAAVVDTPQLAPLPEVSERDERIWEKLSKIKVEILRAYLLGEHPQTAGLILSRLESEAAAKAISSFPAEMRADVLVRMLSIKPPLPEALLVVEQTLAEDLLGEVAPTSHAGIADILNRLDKAQSEDVLKSIAELRPDDAKALKNMLFTFEDLDTLSAQARTLVLDQVPIEKLVTALSGADPTFQGTILSSLAARSRRMAEAELQSGGTGAAREVAEARRVIVDTVLRMAAKGEIVIRPPDDLSDITV